MHKSKLIKDTTREERIAIVQEALSWGDECDGASTQAASVDKFYLPYIKGECELRELNMRKASTSYVLSGNDRGQNGPSCMM